MKKRILSILCCVILISALAVTAFAAEVPDLNRKGTISITMTYNDEIVPGGTLTLYHVAEVSVENHADYRYQYTQDYKDCLVSLEDLDSSATALALAEYTENNTIAGTTAEINAQGQVVFTDLDLGLYLLIQQDAPDGYALVNPFLVSVPGRKDGSYIYDVDASPKLALEIVPTATPEPTPTPVPTPTPPPDLPQTGLNQWPIPILAVGGLVLVVLGLVFYTAGKNKSHEN